MKATLAPSDTQMYQQPSHGDTHEGRHGTTAQSSIWVVIGVLSSEKPSSKKHNDKIFVSMTEKNPHLLQHFTGYGLFENVSIGIVTHHLAFGFAEVF